jgi:hypothetical protein
VVLVSLVFLGASPGDAIRGTVVDAAGQPAVDVEVLALGPEKPRCCGGGGVLARGRTDAAGHFVLQGIDGEVKLVARGGVAGFALTTASPPGPHILRFGVPAWVEGLAPAGADVRARIVYPELNGKQGEAACVADETGAFRLGPLAPGAVAVLEARLPGCRPARSAPICLREGVISTAEFALEPAETLTGRVLDGAGRPLAGATVEAAQGDGFDHRTTTASDGAFALTELAARPVRLLARLDGYGFSITDAALLSPMILTLWPETAIEGRIEPARSGLFVVATYGGVRKRVPIGADGGFLLAGVSRQARLTIETADRGILTAMSIDASGGEVVVKLP